MHQWNQIILQVFENFSLELCNNVLKQFQLHEHCSNTVQSLKAKKLFKTYAASFCSRPFYEIFPIMTCNKNLV